MKERTQMAIELGNPGNHPVLRGQGLISPHHPSRCFARKQAVGIIIESPALRDSPPLDSDRGQCEEKRRRRKGEERSKEERK